MTPRLASPSPRGASNPRAARVLRRDESALSELVIIIIAIAIILLLVLLLFGGLVLTVGLFFGGRLGIALFLFVTGAITLVAMRWIKHQALFWLAVIQFLLAISFLVLGAFGR